MFILSQTSGSIAIINIVNREKHTIILAQPTCIMYELIMRRVNFIRSIISPYYSSNSMFAA